MIIDTINGNNEKEDNFPIIYPNPTTGILHIENCIDSNTTIKILDLTGQEIMKCNLNKIIDLSNLNNGLYILQLESKQSTFVSKIIINK